MTPPATNAGTPRSGSPSTGEPDYLVVGKLRRPHGLHGELLMDIATDFPERLRAGAIVYLGRRHTRAVINNARFVPGGILIRLDGVESQDAAALLRNEIVYVAASDRPPLEDGRYYHHQIVGCAVVDEQGRPLGRITEILQTGANDVYVVKQDSGSDELLLAAIDSVVLGIDLESKQVRVRVPEVFDGAASSAAGNDTGTAGRSESNG